MIEEGRDYSSLGLLEELIHFQSHFGSSFEEQEEEKKKIQRKFSHKKFLNCHFDDQMKIILPLLLEDRTLSSSSSASPAATAVPGEGTVSGGAGIGDSDLLSTRCQEFLLRLSRRHPSLFLRYQSLIRLYLTKPKAVVTTKGQSTKQTTTGGSHHLPSSRVTPKRVSDEDPAEQPQQQQQQQLNATASTTTTSSSCLPPPLPVAITNSKEQKSVTKNLFFTSSGAEIHSNLWESLLVAYENCDPLILHLHATTRPYGMDRVLEIFQDLADRRAVSSFTSFPVFLPPSFSSSSLFLFLFLTRPSLDWWFFHRHLILPLIQN
jgi:hypothetical protein